MKQKNKQHWTPNNLHRIVIEIISAFFLSYTQVPIISLLPSVQINTKSL